MQNRFDVAINSLRMLKLVYQWRTEFQKAGRYLNLGIAAREGIEKHRAIVHVTACESQIREVATPQRRVM